MMKTLFAGAAALALIAPACALSAQPPAPAAAAKAELTAEQWREDLRFMAAEMERRHKNLFHAVSRADFMAAVADLDRRIPTLKREEIIVGMMRIAAMVGDGHTNVSPLKDPKFQFPSLPLRLYLFSDGLYVRAAAPGQEALVGAKVEAIGGFLVAEAMRRAADIAPHDNDFTRKLYIPIFLRMPDILHALKLSDDPRSALLTLSKSGKRWTVKVAAGEVEPGWPSDTDISLVTPPGWTDALGGRPLPLWLQAPLDLHRIAELDGGRVLYAQLNMVAGVEGETLAEYGEKIRARAAALNPRAIILDLRLNRGGNGYLGRPLVAALIKAEDPDTSLFVLTGRGTFSASQFILDDLHRLSGAILVGEPASSKPNSYGDSYKSTLPNSGLTVRSSIYYWQSEQADRPWTPVDIAAPLTFADYAAARDPALEAALAWTPRPPLRERIVEAGKSGGAAGIRKLVAEVEAEGRTAYAANELEYAEAVQSLAQAKLFDAAIAAAELGVARYPRDANLATVFAYVGDWSGRPGIASLWARRTLELDPNNRIIRPLLDKLAKAETR
jgi:hypothetical protein